MVSKSLQNFQICQIIVSVLSVADYSVNVLKGIFTSVKCFLICEEISLHLIRSTRQFSEKKVSCVAPRSADKSGFDWGEHCFICIFFALFICWLEKYLQSTCEQIPISSHEFRHKTASCSSVVENIAYNIARVLALYKSCWAATETHKGLKRVTRVQRSWIFILTIFGNLSDGYPFSTKWLLRDHHADVLRQEFCISRLKIYS